jgi:rod shape-determining protein MreC
MDFILHRYRNLTVLLVVVAAQLVLLAYQVKSNQDMRLLRVWSVTAITPVARLVEVVRGGTVGFIKDYFILLNAREENRRLKQEVDRVKLENLFLKTELTTADRAKALAAFQARTPSRTVASRIIANAAGSNSNVVFVDRGASAGIQPGMAVITPDGIVGKVIAVYPTASQVMLLKDPSFAAGVISEKYRAHGTLKGQGHGTLLVDYVPVELKVEVGEKFFTSGDDRIFPKGLPVGEVKVVRTGRSYKEILIAPSGFSQGTEEVLIVTEGVHQVIPGAQPENVPYHVLPSPTPPVPEEQKSPATTTTTTPGPTPTPTTTSTSTPEVTLTEADRLRERYRKLTELQGAKVGVPGRTPDFNADPNAPRRVAPPAAAAQQTATPPSSPAPQPPSRQQ